MIRIPDQDCTGGRPPRDPRVQAYCGRSLIGQLMLQDAFGYAGDEENPRPLPKRTLGSFKRLLSEYFEATPVESRLRAPQAFHVAFCSDRVKVAPVDAIPVPREDLWWLAAPNDLLLVSDRITHHYTTVERVSTASERIYLLDDWPDRIFLKEGLNSAGVCATVEPYFAGVFDSTAPGRKEVGISRDEYERVIVGLITQDTPALFEHYFAHRPKARESFAINLGCGLAMLDVARDELAGWAVPYLERALAIATRDGDASAAMRAAGACYESLQVAALRARRFKDKLAEKPFRDSLRALLSHFDEAALIEALDIDQLCRLGNAAGWAEDFVAASAYLDLALTRNPGHEGALWLRAKVRLRQNQDQAALKDATEALAANRRRSEEREAERDARDPRDRYGKADDDGRLAGLRSRRGDIHEDRANALIRLGRHEEAREDARQAIECAPKRAGGYRRLAIIEANVGNRGAACELLREAIARESSPRERVLLVQARDALLRGAGNGEAW